MRMPRVLAALAALPLALLPTAVGSAAPPSPATYLALGDSVADGVGAPAGQGYVDLLAGRLSDARNCGKGQALGCRLELQNDSVGGATTSTLITGQLPGALDLLEARNGNATPVDDVRLITITIGGNDVFKPVIEACAPGYAQGQFTTQCQQAVETQFAEVSTNYASILEQLREAAGPTTTIAVMTYYNPLPACYLRPLSGLAELVLEGGGPLPAGLNSLIRGAADRAGALVVETGSLTGRTKFTGGEDCLHPSASGHADIADAFFDVVSPSVVGGPGRR